MLAGLAPLHAERLAARGGPADVAADPGLFYDTSSYGPRAWAAMAAVVGPDQLVFGSDRPVVDAVPPDDGGGLDPDGLVRANVARLLTGASA
jgi:6-methylsalicylate decarboxylase